MRGIQQGDTLRPLLFVLQLILKELQEVEWLCLNIRYLDNRTLCCTRTTLKEAWDLLGTLGPARGLQLNRDKSLESYIGGRVPGVSLGTRGFKLQGAPVGDRRFEGEVLTKRVEGIRVLMQALHSLDDPHIEFNLLPSCFTFPKFSFSMRAKDLSEHQGITRSFDEAVRVGLEEVLGTHLSNNQ